MRVFVAGATGAIGRRLVPQLVAAGHEVIATTRTPAKVDLLRRLGAEPAIVDGLDGAAVGEAVARAEPDAIIHQMTSLAGMRDLRHFDRTFAVTNTLRTQGTDHLLAAAAASGVRRFIAQSYAGWPNARTGSATKDENAPLDADPPKEQRRTLEAIRYLESAVRRAPLEGVVLRYGSFYGPGASDEMVDAVRKRRFPIVGDGGGVWSFIHVEDAASATVAALTQGAPGVYHVVDDEPAPVAEWLPFLARAIGAPPPRHVPVWLGRLLAGEVVVSLMTRTRGSSNARATAELHWRPRWASWRDGFTHALLDSTGASAPSRSSAA